MRYPKRRPLCLAQVRGVGPPGKGKSSHIRARLLFQLLAGTPGLDRFDHVIDTIDTPNFEGIHFDRQPCRDSANMRVTHRGHPSKRPKPTLTIPSLLRVRRAMPCRPQRRRGQHLSELIRKLLLAGRNGTILTPE